MLNCSKIPKAPVPSGHKTPKDLSWPQPNLRCQFKLGLPAGYHFTDDQLDMAIKGKYPN